MNASTVRLFGGSCLLAWVALGIGHAGAVTIHIDGSDRAVGSPSRGAAGRAAWTDDVTARNGTVETDDFDGVNIDVPFAAIRFTADGNGDRFRLDNVSIAR